MIGRVFEVHRAREEAFGERRTRCDQGTASQSCSRNREFATVAIRSHVRSASSSSGRRCRPSRGDLKVESPHCVVGIWIHGHIPRGDASEESQDPQCPVPRSREHGVHTVGQSRRSPSCKGSEHVDVHVNQRGRVCFEECPTTGAVITLCDARCGLRGVRVGEASHPSPPELNARVGEDSWSEVLEDAADVFGFGRGSNPPPPKLKPPKIFEK